MDDIGYSYVFLDLKGLSKLLTKSMEEILIKIEKFNLKLHKTQTNSINYEPIRLTMDDIFFDMIKLLYDASKLNIQVHEKTKKLEYINLHERKK